MHAVNKEFRSSLFDPRHHSLLHFIICGEMSLLEIPLQVRKEMEIAWRQVRAVGRMGENLKLQRLQSINRCASSNKIGDADRLTRQTLRRRFFIVSTYQAELTVFPASKNSVMQTLCESQKTVKRILSADGTVLNFFRRGMKCACIACPVVFLQGQNDESMTHTQ